MQVQEIVQPQILAAEIEIFDPGEHQIRPPCGQKLQILLRVYLGDADIVIITRQDFLNGRHIQLNPDILAIGRDVREIGHGNNFNHLVPVAINRGGCAGRDRCLTGMSRERFGARPVIKGRSGIKGGSRFQESPGFQGRSDDGFVINVQNGSFTANACDTAGGTCVLPGAKMSEMLSKQARRNRISQPQLHEPLP